MRSFKRPSYISNSSRLNNKSVNSKNCTIYSFEQDEENRRNLSSRLLCTMHSSITILGVICILILNVCLTKESSSSLIQINFNNSRKLADVSISDIPSVKLHNSFDNVKEEFESENLEYEQDNESYYKHNPLEDLQDIMNNTSIAPLDGKYYDTLQQWNEEKIQHKLDKLDDIPSKLDKLIIWAQIQGSERLKTYSMVYTLRRLFKSLLKEYNLKQKDKEIEWIILCSNASTSQIYEEYKNNLSFYALMNKKNVTKQQFIDFINNVITNFRALREQEFDNFQEDLFESLKPKKTLYQ
ncbi:Plasmodium exported protein (PHISTa-like), unknown function [Plasmodium reichenowi]|uniref:Plasmodium RESA N-terminal domain-containing protein n=1 Tax=Plasmodium reichenowi TaxID=5854 RepID=A0A060RVJ2_PLARE|nr:Plasmodium exported protein (PHISTa-like), unknown function [Plasmodium reichenowi]